MLAEELARLRLGRVAAGIGAHVNIATPPIWKFGTEEQKQRYLVPAIRGEKIGALAITEPDAGSDVAAHQARRAERVDGGWVRQRREDVHHQRRARALRRHGGQDDRRGRPPRASFLIVDRGRRRERLEAGEARLARLRHRALMASTTSSCPRRTCSASENEGFYLIMANFQWERLAMALGAVGAMQVACERRWRSQASAARSAGR